MIKKRLRKVTVLFVTLCIISSMIMSTAFAASDISNHWAETTIQSWLDQGFTTGYPDGSFRPDNNITRAEFMALVNKGFGYTETAPISYPDVKATEWYYNSVAVAKAAGYISGYPDGTMKPENLISREEAAAIIMKIKTLETNADAANVFTDASKMTWSKGVVGAVADAKIMNGYPDGSFGPQKLIKRGESVTLISSSFLVESVFADLVDVNSDENTKSDLEVAIEKEPINYNVANLSSDFYQIISAESGKQIGYKKGAFDIIDVNNQYFYINLDLEKYKLETMYGDALTAEWYKTHDIVKIAPDKNLYNQLWDIYEFEDGYYIRYGSSTQFLSLVDNKMILSYTPHKFYINKRIQYNEKEFVRYAQDYPEWKYRKYSYKTMNYTGCGPTALAMVTNYYSNQTVTPLTVADISVANNLDIIPNPRTDMPKLAPMIADKFGLNMKFIEKYDVMSELKNGNMVIVQTALNPLINYTNGVGHYLVLKGLDKNGWIIVSDPLKGHSYHTKPDASIQDFDKIHTYVAPESAVLAKVRESYSFWKK